MKRFHLLVLLFIVVFSHASEEVLTFSLPENSKRYHVLIDELRCLVCQNQTIADSNAGLAVDLREQVHAMIEEGKTDKDIKDFLVERYGDFVLYDPPFKMETLLLWVLPPVAGLLALIGLIVYIRKRNKKAQHQPLSVNELEELESLLRENDENLK